ncbi:uncharacterized protein B0H18DRAFT_1124422 [Fomitopsis serialis]|uniref:uncharacterized protein n=1 Tax=Fomitopsis serialis TaxID=139415 RepID=UPI002008C6FB|nr:uncharacterized protein B0H18DRAFT_1124422 [Neoantrodia serialis]KAH9916134.1 hypothetical protein B0H18DRAFT_1124422 [Neoantrodia serialis]
MASPPPDATAERKRRQHSPDNADKLARSRKAINVSEARLRRSLRKSQTEVIQSQVGDGVLNAPAADSGAKLTIRIPARARQGGQRAASLPAGSDGHAAAAPSSSQAGLRPALALGDGLVQSSVPSSGVVPGPGQVQASGVVSEAPGDRASGLSQLVMRSNPYVDPNGSQRLPALPTIQSYIPDSVSASVTGVQDSRDLPSQDSRSLSRSICRAKSEVSHFEFHPDATYRVHRGSDGAKNRNDKPQQTLLEPNGRRITRSSSLPPQHALVVSPTDVAVWKRQASDADRLSARKPSRTRRVGGSMVQAGAPLRTVTMPPQLDVITEDDESSLGHSAAAAADERPEPSTYAQQHTEPQASEGGPALPGSQNDVFSRPPALNQRTDDDSNMSDASDEPRVLLKALASLSQHRDLVDTLRKIDFTSFADDEDFLWAMRAQMLGRDVRDGQSSTKATPCSAPPSRALLHILHLATTDESLVEFLASCNYDYYARDEDFLEAVKTCFSSATEGASSTSLSDSAEMPPHHII